MVGNVKGGQLSHKPKLTEESAIAYSDFCIAKTAGKPCGFGGVANCHLIAPHCAICDNTSLSDYSMDSVIPEGIHLSQIAQ